MDPHGLLSRLSADAPISGSSLAAELGVTRAAVWKQVEALRALGAPIEAEAGLGYRLAWPIEWLDGARIAAELEPEQRSRLGGVAVHWQIDSTSSELQRRAAADAGDLLVCCAETQTAGRGRRGRNWRSPLDGNLYFSVLKRFDHGMGALTGLSLAVGTAVIAALADCGVTDAGLKHLVTLKNLKVLNLSDTDIGDVGLEPIGQMTSLESLNLTLTKITDAGLARLTKLTKLKSLSMGQTNVTDAGVKRLLKALPNCKLTEEE